MTNNQKDAVVEGNPTSEQNQVKKTNDDKQQKSSDPTIMPSTAQTEDDKRANADKEHSDKQHQHEFTNPLGDQNRKDENKEKNPDQKPAFDVNTNPISKPAAENKA